MTTGFGAKKRRPKKDSGAGFSKRRSLAGWLRGKGPVVIMAAFSLLILAGGVAWLGRSSAPKAVSTGRLEASPREQDFGEVAIDGDHVILEYEVENGGDQPVTIYHLATSCMCTKAQLRRTDGKTSAWAGMAGHRSGGPINPNWTVDPGQKVTVVADFDPAAHGLAGIGAVKREVVLKSTSRESPNLTLILEGTVIR